MVRLPAPVGPGAGDEWLVCDHYTECGEWIRYGGNDGFDRVRVKGWHIYEGVTIGGQMVTYLLGPDCVGRRKRLDPAPPVLPGQEGLF